LTTDLSASRPNLLRAWWPAVVWIGLIAFESTDFFSAQHTGSLLYTVLTRLFGQINFYDFLIFHHYLRKTGHVVGYGMLSLLLLRGWRVTLGRIHTLLLRAALLSWLGTAIVAALDEWHQSYIPSRTGTIWDVALDSVAGVTFLIIAYLWLRRSPEDTPDYQ
jgi:VanZ like protein